MTAIDYAKQMAKALAESEELKKLKEAKKVLEEHEAAKIMMQDFRKKQFEFEKVKMSGENTEALEKELMQMSTIVQANPYVREYLMAEFAFGGIMMEIQKLIEEVIQD